MLSKFIIPLCFILINVSLFSQSIQKIVLDAHVAWKTFNKDSGRLVDFLFCANTVFTDTAGFFTIQSGCERNIHVYLGHYTFYNDSFAITPFDFMNEDPFLKVIRKRKTSLYQEVKFYTADLQPVKGVDSSWVIRLFNGRKHKWVDNTGSNTLSFKRGAYHGAEFIQLSKIFGLPIIFWFDDRYDYKVVLNAPKEALSRYIVGAGPLQGEAVIENNKLFFIGEEEGYIINRIIK